MTTTPSARFVVFPLNLNGSSNITTAISEVSSAKKAKTIRYYNTLGTESSHPSKGINIVITTHTDGTTTAKNPPLIPRAQNRATGKRCKKIQHLLDIKSNRCYFFRNKCQ